MPSRELVMKPTFTNQVLGLPDGVLASVMEKASRLLDDPYPDGSHKKKLASRDDIYRLRVGRYRVFYAFGPTWVRLLKVEHRNSAYQGELPRHGDDFDLPPDEGFDDFLEEPPRETAAAVLASGSVPAASRAAPSGSVPAASRAAPSGSVPAASRAAPSGSVPAAPGLAASAEGRTPAATPVTIPGPVTPVPGPAPAPPATGLSPAPPAPGPSPVPPTAAPAAPASRPLSEPITSDWLASLRVPEEYRACLCACRDEAALLEAPVPEDILWRVVDNLWPRDLEAVERQPDYVVQDPQDLKRYKDGDLLGFLLRLDPDQAELVGRRGQGPSIVKGGPGSGKSTVAIYRVKWILDQAEAEGRPAPRILFTTYTNALTRFSEQLLQQLLGDRAASVTVSTADTVAWKIVAATRQMPDRPDSRALTDILRHVRTQMAQRRRRAEDAVVESRSWQRLSPEFLFQEFDWIIEGRNLKTLKEYLAADRTGRVLPLSEELRRAVWNLYQDFRTELAGRGILTYGQIRNLALDLVRKGEDGGAARQGQGADGYDAVIIDEAQDLTPSSLMLLTELCRDRSLLFLTADGSQSIYSRGFTWQRVNDSLRFTGRTRLLKRNYRTSRQIAEAANAFMRRAGAGDHECLGQEHVHDGPRPVLLGYRSEDEQWAAVADFIRQSALSLKLPIRGAAVLVPTNSYAETAASGLSRCGLPARCMRGADLDLEAPEVKVMTLHSAKGLEFPIVVVAGLRDGILPRPRAGMTPEELEEDDQAYRRLLFVGFTRAMRALLVTYPVARPSRFVGELDSGYWARPANSEHPAPR